MGDKRRFAKSLYKLSKEELGQLIIDIENKYPEALTKNESEDEVEINVDDLTPVAFQDCMEYSIKCAANSNKKATTRSTENKGDNTKQVENTTVPQQQQEKLEENVNKVEDENSPKKQRME